MKCNFDCFNCKFPDCKCKSNAPPTPWEKAAMRYALMGNEAKIRKPMKTHEKANQAERSAYMCVHSA